MGKRAEAQGPVPPTIVTNVITNLANNVVTNTVPVKPKPNPVKTRTIYPKDIVGTYERKSGTDTFKMAFLDNGTAEYYKNADKRNESKWSILGKELQIIYSDSENRYTINPDNSLTFIAIIKDGKRRDLPK